MARSNTIGAEADKHNAALPLGAAADNFAEKVLLAKSNKPNITSNNNNTCTSDSFTSQVTVERSHTLGTINTGANGIIADLCSFEIPSTGKKTSNQKLTYL